MAFSLACLSVRKKLPIKRFEVKDVVSRLSSSDKKFVGKDEENDAMRVSAFRLRG